MNKEIIILKNISKKFGAIQALDNVSLEIAEGSIFGLLGTNGAGKTTLIKIMLGLVSSTSGNGKIMGYDIETESNKIREKTGVLLDHTGLYGHLTVFDNLDFYGRIWRLNKNERRTKISELLEYFHINDKSDALVSTLSKGTQQKVAIARTLIGRPQLLILDEPTTGLDPVSTISLRDILVKITKEYHITILLNTHNLREAEIICDEIGILQNGQLLKTGNVKELCRTDNKQEYNIYVKNVTNVGVAKLQAKINCKINMDKEQVIITHDSGQLNLLLDFILSEGGEIVKIESASPSLEETFIKHIKL